MEAPVDMLSLDVVSTDKLPFLEEKVVEDGGTAQQNRVKHSRQHHCFSYKLRLCLTGSVGETLSMTGRQKDRKEKDTTCHQQCFCAATTSFLSRLVTHIE